MSHGHAQPPPAVVPDHARLVRYRTMLARMHQAYALVRLVRAPDGRAVDCRFEETNAALEALVANGPALGRSALALAPHLEIGWVHEFERVARDGVARRFERHDAVTGRWFDVSACLVDDADRDLVALVFTDVTERRRVEEALRTSEERLRHSQEAGNVGVFDHDLVHDTTWWSDAQWRLFGHAPAPHLVPATLFRDAVHPEDRDALDAAVNRCLRGDVAPLRHTMRIVRPDGATRWIEIVARVTRRDGRGAPERLAGVNIDVTTRVEAQLALAESERRFRVMADELPQIVWVHDETGKLRFVNRTYCAFFGIPAEEATGDNWIPLTHPDDSVPYVQAFEAAVRDRTPFRAQLRVRDARGDWRWIDSYARPHFDDAGRYLGHVGTSVDVTADREAAAERAELARQRQLALDAARLAWWSLDAATGRIAGDARLRDIFGLPDDALIDVERFYARVPADDRDRVRAVMATAMDPAEGTPFVTVHRVQHPTRGLRWVEATGRADFAVDAAGRRTLRSLVGTVADVTEREAAAAALREADRRKDDFLAVLAHELRNPLAPVRHAVELLRRADASPAAAARAREIIGRQVAHMTHLIDDLLDVSRIARGLVQLRTAPVDLRDIARAAVESYRAGFDAAGVRLRVELPDQPLPIDGDATRLAQVVANLLHNAEKFTPRDGVVTVRVVEDGADVRLEVRDTGIGIAPALLPHLFTPFSQAEQGLDRSHGGLGLGLALVRGLVELHGGRVTARSDGTGQGTTMTVTLPRRTRAAAVALPGAPMPTSASFARRVLVVEDNRDAAEMLRALLESAGHTVCVTHDGDSGVAAARSWSPDVVLCDIGLPGALDGYAVARLLRADPALAAVPLVALSGYGRTQDRERALSAGFDHHLVKPVDLATLATALGAGRPAPSAVALSTLASRGR
ncbi:MAG: PAS domain-containing protein [Gemmatimonadaceae bacterium]|nr:PAS domain-containing protein [Gemmatimonadaceae bacterium]